MGTPPVEAEPLIPEDLMAYVGGNGDESDGTDYEEVLAAAVEMVNDHVSEDPPAAIYRQAVLEVGSKIAARRQSPNVSLDGLPSMAPKDPMVTVYQMLAPYAPVGFA